MTKTTLILLLFSFLNIQYVARADFPSQATATFTLGACNYQLTASIANSKVAFNQVTTPVNCSAQSIQLTSFYQDTNVSQPIQSTGPLLGNGQFATANISDLLLNNGKTCLLFPVDSSSSNYLCKASIANAPFFLSFKTTLSTGGAVQTITAGKWVPDFVAYTDSSFLDTQKMQGVPTSLFDLKTACEGGSNLISTSNTPLYFIPSSGSSSLVSSFLQPVTLQYAVLRVFNGTTYQIFPTSNLAIQEYAQNDRATCLTIPGLTYGTLTSNNIDCASSACRLTLIFGNPTTTYAMLTNNFMTNPNMGPAPAGPEPSNSGYLFLLLLIIPVAGFTVCLLYWLINRRRLANERPVRTSVQPGQNLTNPKLVDVELPTEQPLRRDQLSTSDAPPQETVVADLPHDTYNEANHGAIEVEIPVPPDGDHSLHKTYSQIGQYSARSQGHGPIQSNHQYNCKQCTTARADTAFLPCGHVYLCGSCAKSRKVCDICKKEADVQFKVGLPKMVEYIDALQAQSPKTKIERIQKEDPICIMCLVNEISVLHLPCQHARCCAECGAKANLCSGCRQTVDQNEKLHFVE